MVGYQHPRLFPQFLPHGFASMRRVDARYPRLMTSFCAAKPPLQFYQSGRLIAFNHVGFPRPEGMRQNDIGAHLLHMPKLPKRLRSFHRHHNRR